MPLLSGPSLKLPRLAMPPPPAALALIAAAFLLPGLWHDPWKYWDAVGIGIARSMASGEGLLVSSVAGIPWMYDPPLFHWAGAAFGRLLRPALEFHTAVRLAGAAFVALAFWLLYAAGRAAMPDRGREAGAAALLILLGSVGLMVHAHEALPELATLAALAGALAVLPHATRRPVAAGLAHGAALGLAFLGSGWITPVSVLIALVGAALAHAGWRNARGAAFLALAAGTASLLAGAWLGILAIRAPGAFLDWWQLAVQAPGAPFANLGRILSTTSWFAWPAWPLALWALWSLRRRWREPALLVPALASIAMLALHGFRSPAEQENLIPLLAPLALLGAHGLFTLRRGALGAFDWFGVVTFGFFTALVWLGYTALLTGFPPRIEYNLTRMAPGFEARFALVPFLVALALLAGWLSLVFLAPTAPVRSVARWAGGVVLLWGTFILLGLPWADHQKSYRSVALELRSRMPAGPECIAQRGLGVPQAAALDHHAGIRARPYDLLKPAACPLLLVQGAPAHERDAPAAAAGGKWRKIADVGRPGDRSERYRLYRFTR